MATKKAPAKKASAKKTTAKKAPVKKAAKLSLIAATVANAREANARKGRDYLHTIESKLSQVEECFYEIGAALVGLRAPAVWGALGAESFQALIATLPHLSPATCFRLMRIAEHYTETTAITLTSAKADALITYVEATPEVDDAETLAREDAVIAGLPISKQTALAIRAAAADVRPASKAKKRPGEVEAKAHATKLERALEAATKEAVNVRLVHRKGAFRVVMDVPVELASRIALKK
jgi:hypothetical protein